MPPKHRLTCTIALLTLTAFTGCGLHRETFTYKLWQSDEFRRVREPATPNPALTIHFSPLRKDYLISYESAVDGEAWLRQAYFLGEFETRESGERKPHLVASNGLELVAVPINGATNVVPRATFKNSFTIYTGEGFIGPCALPAYPETSGLGSKLAMTPIAVLGDVGCVSLIIGMIGLIGFARGGGSINNY